MTKLKKFTSVAISAMMVLSMGLGVMADDTTTITIENASEDSYKLYKIFDVEEDKGDLTYYVSGESKWYDEIIKDTDAPFTVGDLDENKMARVYLTADAEITDATPWIKAHLAGKDSVNSEKDNDDIVFKNVGYGYYYVTTTTGTVVIIDHATSSNVTLSDKSTVPSWDPRDPSTSDDTNEYGKFIADTDAPTDWGKKTNAGIGDVQYFMINAYVPKKNGSLSIYDYTITDTLDAGFREIKDVKAVVSGGEKDIDLSSKITLDGNKITLEYVVSKIDGYPDEAHVSITYTAVVDNDAVIFDTTDGSEKVSNDNIATLEWTQYDPDKGDPTPDGTTPNPDGNLNTPEPPKKHENPSDPNSDLVNDYPDPSDTKTYVYGFELLKIDAEDKDEEIPTPLEGAKFKLMDGEDAVELVKMDDGNYRLAEDADKEDGSSVDVTTEIEAGKVTIVGFDIVNSYELVETEAPKGYNKLSTSVSVTFKDGEAGKTLTANKVVVENSQGVELPSTGGIGTRVFYVTGAVVMLGAVVLLVAKKRTSDK